MGWKTIWFEPSCPFNKVLIIFFTKTNLIGSGSVLLFSFRRILVKGIVKWAEPCNCYSSHFQDTLTLENQPFVKRMEILIFDTHWPLSASLQSAIPVKAAYLHQKNLWHRVVEGSKKQVSLKSYSLEIRIDSVNQILKNKEKIK